MTRPVCLVCQRHPRRTVSPLCASCAPKVSDYVTRYRMPRAVAEQLVAIRVQWITGQQSVSEKRAS